jgi:hypothetical protein
VIDKREFYQSFLTAKVIDKRDYSGVHAQATE